MFGPAVGEEGMDRLTHQYQLPTFLRVFESPRAQSPRPDPWVVRGRRADCLAVPSPDFANLSLGGSIFTMRGLKSKPVIVTGGASRCRAIAGRLAMEDAVVGIFDINGQSGRSCGQCTANVVVEFGYEVDIVD